MTRLRLSHLLILFLEIILSLRCFKAESAADAEAAAADLMATLPKGEVVRFRI